MSALDAVEHLVGMQAQAPFAVLPVVESPRRLHWRRAAQEAVRVQETEFPGVVLVDGFVAGTWELVGKGEATSMRVQPYHDLDVVDDVIAEGNRLLELAFRAAAPRVEITR